MVEQQQPQVLSMKERSKLPRIDELQSEAIAIEVSKLRANGATFAECAKVLGITVQVAHRHYSRWAKKNLEYLRSNPDALIQDFVSTKFDLLRKSQQKNDVKTANVVSDSIFDRLQTVGMIPDSKPTQQINVLQQNNTQITIEQAKQAYLEALNKRKTVINIQDSQKVVIEQSDAEKK